MRIGYLRQTRREQFLKATGIDVDERHTMTQRLEQVAETGSMTVAETILMAKQEFVDVVNNSNN